MADELMTFDNVRRVLEEFGVAVRNLYQDNLVRSDALATGALLNTAESRVVVDGREFLVQLTLQDYWKYLEHGTPPHWPPTSALLRWIRVKPVIPRSDSRGRIPSERSLAYLIGRKIAREGTEGRHNLRDALQRVNAEFAGRLEEALRQDVGKWVAGAFTTAVL